MYDIVNGRSQGVALETVDRLLSGPVQLPGRRVALEAVLNRQEPEDSYLLLFVGAKPLKWEQACSALFIWIPGEQAVNDALWAGHETRRQAGGSRGNKRLGAPGQIVALTSDLTRERLSSHQPCSLSFAETRPAGWSTPTSSALS